MSDEALAYVSTLPFPGNVRQLENLCNWLTVMAPAQTIEVKDLPREMLEAGTSEPVNAPRPERVAEARAPEYESAPDLADYGGYATTVAEADTATAVRPASVATVVPALASAGWESLLAGEARAMLEAGQPEVMDVLTRRFEKAVLEAALGVTRGRRVEAATRLGIGRNTITRKLQELGFD
ncbi:Nitrogen regulation protein NR(I) [compost metagenome]